MLEYTQIKGYFSPQIVKRNPKGTLVEYLQYETLDSIFKQAAAVRLSFIGGTAIRIIHDSQRFSQDLDFDNFGLSYPDFQKLIYKTVAELKLKGLELELNFIKKDKNFHAYLRFPNLLFKSGITNHSAEKIFLSIDTEDKKKLFEPEIKTINKFGIFRKIAVNPAPILLAQKLLAILGRKREKGRDFFDASFLAGKTKIDYQYIEKITGLNKEAFATQLVKRCNKLNFKALATDVEPFLFSKEQQERVINFKDYLSEIL